MFNQKIKFEASKALALFDEQMKIRELQFNEFFNAINPGDEITYQDMRCCNNWHKGVYVSRTKCAIVIEIEDGSRVRFAYFEPVSFAIKEKPASPVDVLETRMAMLTMYLFKQIREQGFSEQLEKDFFGFMRKEFESVTAN
uniref:Uncharacterized protein n=1 Tax=Pectobacterium carotovorum TaxID=554 RepID=A0A0K0MNV3_PECCA|nr:hypothetical protein [Pectobacterium carotovorum]AKG47500.1 hypothetical protein pA_00060 [Pectobacterium carotovorum]